MSLHEAVRWVSTPSSEEEGRVLRSAGDAPAKDGVDAAKGGDRATSFRKAFGSSSDGDRALGGGGDGGFGNHVDIEDDERSYRDFLAPVPGGGELDAHFGALDNMSDFSEISDGDVASPLGREGGDAPPRRSIAPRVPEEERRAEDEALERQAVEQPDGQPDGQPDERHTTHSEQQFSGEQHPEDDEQQLARRRGERRQQGGALKARG